MLINSHWASLRASLNPKMHEDMDLITKELRKVEILCQIFYQRSYSFYKIFDRKSGIVDLFQHFSKFCGSQIHVFMHLRVHRGLASAASDQGLRYFSRMKPYICKCVTYTGTFLFYVYY